MSKTLLFLFCFLFPIILFSQQLKVIDQQGKGIENVIVLGDRFTTHTNSNGFLIYFPDEGTTKLSFVHPNYKRLTLNWIDLAKKDFIITLDEINQQLQEVIVKPAKRIQSVSNIPQRVVFISAESVQLSQPQNTADLVGTSGEVFIQKSQMGGGSPMMRGFSANRIMLVVDGVRLNNATYRSGNLQNIISIDAMALDHTEVIFGPGSVIYGSDALGGVISIYTLKTQLSTSELKTPVHVLTRYSTANNEKMAHIDFNLGGKKWATLSSLSITDYDDLVMGNHQHNDYIRPQYVKTIDGIDEIVVNENPNKQIYTAYSQLNLMQKLRFRPTDFADFEYAFHFSKTSDIPRYDRLIEYSGEKLKYAEWYYGPQQWIMHSLKGDFTGKGNIYNNLSITAAYQDFTESRHDRKFGKTTRNSRTENVDIFSLNADADIYFSNTQSVYYGVEGLYNKIHSTAKEFNVIDGTFNNITTRYPNGSEWWSLAAYTMYNQQLSNVTSLQAGARYNFTGMSGQFDPAIYNFPFSEFNNTDGALTLNFGMVFKLTAKNRFHLNGSTGFRSPNIDDAAKVFDSEPGNVIVPNPNLEPEYASTFEAGWNYTPEQNFTVEFTGYITRLYNAMVRREGQMNGNDSILYDGQMSKVLMLTNTSWANIGGISTCIIYSPFTHFKLKGGLNWQTGHDNDNLPVRHIAPLFGDVHLIYEPNKFAFDIYALLNGEISYENLATDERAKPVMYAKDKNGKPYSPAWWTLNLKGRYSISKQIEFGAGIENILDVRYRPYSSGIVASGINFIISLNGKF